MLFIVGMNISRSPRTHWRAGLGGVIEQFTAQFWWIPLESVTCFFPHDPSVPEKPWPIAMFVVDLFFHVFEKDLGRQKEFATKLGERIETFLNKTRKTTGARVLVSVRSHELETSSLYTTPSKS